MPCTMRMCLPPPPAYKPPAPPPTHTALALVTPAGAVQVKVPGVSNTVSPAGTQVVEMGGPPVLPRPAPQGWHTMAGPGHEEGTHGVGDVSDQQSQSI
jgi:hypothetical protein